VDSKKEDAEMKISVDIREGVSMHARLRDGAIGAWTITPPDAWGALSLELVFCDLTSLQAAIATLERLHAAYVADPTDE
jgi:hypothetical protein